MTYQEAMDYLEQAKSRGIVTGLDCMKELCHKLGNPQNASRFIHVGGTNGKGSVIAFISSVLSEAGYLVGRYVSPAVFQYEEIIQFQTKDSIEYISKDEITEGISRIREAENQLMIEEKNLPTLFEIETALAFLTFSKRNCDIVLLEAGMGGRLDATNIISNPTAVVLTAIDFDHMAFLGDSIEKIAEEKAGIIKENSPVITAEQPAEAMHILEEACDDKGAALTKVKKDEIKIRSADLEGTGFLYEGEKYFIRLLGEHQVWNAAQAVAAVRSLTDFRIGKENMVSGLKKAEWKGRLQVIRQNPLVIVDGAHNQSGARQLRYALKTYAAARKIIGIIGVFADKDYEAVCREVLPVMQKASVVPTAGERALSADILLHVAGNYVSDVRKEENIVQAYKNCLSEAEKEDVIVIFGTLSILKDLVTGE